MMVGKSSVACLGGRSLNTLTRRGRLVVLEMSIIYRFFLLTENNFLANVNTGYIGGRSILVNVIKNGPCAVGAKALFLHQCHRAFLASACPAPSLYVFGKRDVLSIEKPTFTEVRRQFFY